MELLKRLKATLFGYKSCGCKESVADDHLYQFRVQKLEEGATDDMEFQVRKKRICSECEDEAISVVIEGDCTYEPSGFSQVRTSTADKSIFMEKDNLVRLITELRLGEALKL